MSFVNKDTGFVTGTGPLPMQTAVVLYTADGGQTWAYKFQDTIPSEYIWKIQRLTDKIYFGNIERQTTEASRIIKSVDGGMTWTVHVVAATCQFLEGIGFIDSLKGWAGGWGATNFESNDGGITWDSIAVCPWMNRVFKVNDTLLFASGKKIWKYNALITAVKPVPAWDVTPFVTLDCHPNPANEFLTINVSLHVSTHVLLLLLDEKGNRIKIVDSSNKFRGDYQYALDAAHLSPGVYYLTLKTHEDERIQKLVVSH
jgi:hypothetical protein